MPKIWVDLSTPKQVMFFSSLFKILRDKGFDLLITSREYYELTQMLEKFKIDAQIIGKHGGKTLKGKLIASLDRAKELVELGDQEKPDLLITLTSDVAIRVAFGLGIPRIISSDTPWAFAVNKLSIPYANKFVAPKATNYEVWRSFGVLEEDIVYYDAIDSAAWIKFLTPDPNVLKSLNLNEDQPIVVLRPEETYAAYVLDFGVKEPIIFPTIRAILENFSNVQIVALPRYREHKKVFRENFQEKVVVPESIIDVPSLLTYASLEMGYGGTITQEAAILGVPAISCYPELLWCDAYLEEKGLLYRANSPEHAAEISVKILKDRETYLEKHKKLAHKVLQEMDNPIEIISKVAIEFLESNKKKH